jgi:uncharacterized protein
LLLDFRVLAAAGDVLALRGEVDIPRIADENAQVEQLSPIETRLVATKEHEVCRVEGELRTSLRYQCSRCLDSYESLLETPFDESFTNAPGHEDAHVVEGTAVELDPYIEETVNLALEYRPLCRESCQGLCPVCGCNLNHETCNCDRQARDPRWAALEDLLLDDKPE